MELLPTKLTEVTFIPASVNMDVPILVACKGECRGRGHNVRVLPSPAATSHTRQLSLMGRAVQDPVISLRKRAHR